MLFRSSKGLEFPVVIVAGCGKKFNMQDLNASILLHQDLGFGPDLVDLEKRTIIPSLPKFAIRQKLRLETLSEEMRILYVAFTRAREKLIITGSVRDHARTLASWREKAAGASDKLSPYDMMQASSYLDWIGPAVIKQDSPGAAEDACGTGDDDIHLNRPLVEIKFWGTGAARLEKGAPEAAENAREWLCEIHGRDTERPQMPGEETKRPEEECTESPENPDVKQIIEALEWTYPYQKLTTVPAKISVTELKRRALQEEVPESAVPYIQPMQERPLFMEPDKGMSAAHRGTVMHFVMQHLDLGRLYEAAKSAAKDAAASSAPSGTSDSAGTAEGNALPMALGPGTGADQPDGLVMEISSQISSMTVRELITPAEAGSVDPEAVAAFFRSPFGMRMLSLHDSIHRETAFTIEIKCSELHKDDADGAACGETMLLQGVIDCWFETGDGLVLLDYKTDYVPEGRSDMIRDRYKVQLQYYTKALEKITGKKVTERYLYLFHSGELVAC